MSTARRGSRGTHAAAAPEVCVPVTSVHPDSRDVQVLGRSVSGDALHVGGVLDPADGRRPILARVGSGRTSVFATTHTRDIDGVSPVGTSLFPDRQDPRDWVTSKSRARRDLSPAVPTIRRPTYVRGLTFASRRGVRIRTTVQGAAQPFWRAEMHRGP